MNIKIQFRAFSLHDTQTLNDSNHFNLIPLEVHNKFVEHMQDTHVQTVHRHAQMLKHTQARWSRRGKAKCACTSSVCRVSSLQQRLLNPLRLMFKLLIQTALLFYHLPSLPLAIIKITSVCIYANTWQAADAPFLPSAKQNKKREREDESRTGAHLGLEPLAWSRCGPPGSADISTPGHSSQQQKQRGRGGCSSASQLSILIFCTSSHSFSFPLL